MATILSDTELKKLFGTVIMDADESCIRPNSYVLRLGSHGAFISTEKEFEIGEKKKKGIRLPPGHSVGITAHEKIDFRHETVEKIFPQCDFHGFLSPTTDLAREGILAPSTQVDAGYRGTLNWTLTNTSGKAAEFVHGEKLFRLTIICLEEGEKPEFPYRGDYQGKEGYVASKRSGAPRGMKSSDWIDAFVEGGPEGKIEDLVNLGYPWNMLGSRLKHVDDQLKTVTDEYAEIKDSIDALDQKVSDIQRNIADTVRNVFRNREDALMLRFFSYLGSSVAGFTGLALFLREFSGIWTFIISNKLSVGVLLMAVCILLVLWTRKRK